VALTSQCSGNSAGYAVSVADDADVEVASGTTDASGAFCASGLAFGDYGVTATRAGCNSFFATVAVDSCSTSTVAGDAKCSTNESVNVTVSGCFGFPLPGAVVTYSGPDSGSVTTDAAGEASFFTDKTGSFSFTVAHPSGRFASASGTFAKATKCTAAGITRQLSPASGFVCCDVLKGGSSPYPISKTLTLTDPSGATTVAIDALTCQGSVCVDRSMSDVSPTVSGSLQCPKCTCTVGGSSDQPAADVGFNSTAVQYQATLSDPPTLGQAHYIFQWIAAGGVQYRADCPTTHLCTADTRRTWRFGRACGAGFQLGFPHRSDGPSSVTVNSYMPLNITFNYSHGSGFGPVALASTVDGDVFATTLNLSE
jgi:hypothetical protein